MNILIVNIFSLAGENKVINKKFTITISICWEVNYLLKSLNSFIVKLFK